LSLSKRIIEQYHNGSIFVKQSEPGKGTTFRIILPV
jgi:signal transduction histidine kinase